MVPFGVQEYLVGGFKYFLFSPLFGEDFQFDEYFSDGLVQPPTRYYCTFQSDTCNHWPLFDAISVIRYRVKKVPDHPLRFKDRTPNGRCWYMCISDVYIYIQVYMYLFLYISFHSHRLLLIYESTNGNLWLAVWLRIGLF